MGVGKGGRMATVVSVGALTAARFSCTKHGVKGAQARLRDRIRRIEQPLNARIITGQRPRRSPRNGGMSLSAMSSGEIIQDLRIGVPMLFFPPTVLLAVTIRRPSWRSF